MKFVKSYRLFCPILLLQSDALKNFDKGRWQMAIPYYIKKFIPYIMFAVILGVIFLLGSNADKEETGVIEEMMEEIDTGNEEKLQENEAPPAVVVVDIKGEVKNPGVYTLEHDARVYDLIELAGGFTEKAVVNEINLAQKVYDEMVLYVPKQGAENNLTVPVTTQRNSRDTGVAINRATVEEIMQLNGIGPAKAEAIISYREEHGPFQSVEELLEVSGIGEKTLEKIRDQIIIP